MNLASDISGAFKHTLPFGFFFFLGFIPIAENSRIPGYFLVVNLVFLEPLRKSIRGLRNFSMPPFTSTTKAVLSLLSRRNGFRNLVRYSGKVERSKKLHQSRCFFSGIAGIETGSVRQLIGSANQDVSSLSGAYFDVSNVQRRRFLGCGDGEEGGVLSKVYEERRVLGYFFLFPFSFPSHFLFRDNLFDFDRVFGILGILQSNYLMWLLRLIYIMALFPGVSGLMYLDIIPMDRLMLS